MATSNRVHSSDVYNSFAFDELSLGAQVLYTRCVANADDYGVAELELIYRTASKVRKPAIKELLDSGLVTLIQQKGTIVYINGFHSINSFAKHGMRKSHYVAAVMQNSYTRNAVSNVKTKDKGNPMYGNAMSGYVTTGDATLFFDMFCKQAEKEKLDAFAPHTYNSLGDYYKYLEEIHADNVTETSIAVMIRQCLDKAEEFGDYQVGEYIDKAIANGWKNINWQYLEREVDGDSYC